LSLSNSLITEKGPNQTLCGLEASFFTALPRIPCFSRPPRKILIKFFFPYHHPFPSVLLMHFLPYLDLVIDKYFVQRCPCPAHCSSRVKFHFPSFFFQSFPTLVVPPNCKTQLHPYFEALGLSSPLFHSLVCIISDLFRTCSFFPPLSPPGFGEFSHPPFFFHNFVLLLD